MTELPDTPIPDGALLELAKRLTVEVPDWFIWKSADAGLVGEGDIDSAAPKPSWARVKHLFINWASDLGMQNVVACTHVPRGLVLVTGIMNERSFLQLDVWAEQPWRGASLFRAQDLISLTTLDERGFRRLEPGAEGVLVFVVQGTRRAGGQNISTLEKKQVFDLLSSDSDGVEKAIAQLALPERSLRTAIDAFLSGGWDSRSVQRMEAASMLRGLRNPSVMLERASFRRKGTGACAVLRSVLVDKRRIVNAEEWLQEVSLNHSPFGRNAGSADEIRVLDSDPGRNRFGRTFHENAHQGRSFLIVGPDGSGKSAVTEALAARLSERGPVMRLHHRPGVLPGRGRHEGPVEDPHAGTPYSRTLSLFKVLYVFGDFMFGRRRVTPFRAGGGSVLMERGWLDLAVDPKRYRLSAGERLVGFLARFQTRLDLTVVLEAPTDVLLSRKRELSGEELERQMRRWRELLQDDSRAFFLDATRPVSELCAEIERRAFSSGKSLEEEWVNLPSRHDPRWRIPRSPRMAAHGGLIAYHPVTLKGLIGWRLARGLSATGAFGLLPRGSSPPGWMRRLVAPYLSNGDVFAVARANHDGRAVAILLHQTGDVFAVAKLASTAAGRAALVREKEGIDELGRRLPHGIDAPEILDVADGLLLQRAALWTPRLRSWELPSEVAGALGELFASSETVSNDQGLAHGDCAPWNLLRNGTGWTLIDWEEWRRNATPYFDIYHFLVQAHALLGRPSARNLMDVLKGSGELDSCLRAYESAAQISAADRSYWLERYLRVSTATLTADSKAGRKSLKARAALMGAIEGE